MWIHKRFGAYRLVAVIVFVLGFASLANAQSPSALSVGVQGRYGGVISGPSLGDAYVILKIERDAEGKLRGDISIANSTSTLPLDDLAVAGNTLTATLQYSGTAVTLRLSTEEDRLRGTYQAGPEVGTILLRRLLPAESDAPVLQNLAASDWRADFDYFAQQLPVRHANLFHRISRSQFQAEVAAMKSSPLSATPPGAVTALGRITADIGDAHTRVVTPSSFHRYPVQVFWFANHLRIIAADRTLREILGAELLAINGVPVDRIRRATDSLVSKGETRWYELDRTPVYMMSAERLQAFGFCKDAQSPATFKVRNGTKIGTVRVTPVPVTMEFQFVRLGGPEEAQRAAAPFAAMYLAQENLVYAVFNNYESLPSAVAEFFALVDSHPSARVLIDMRQNGGGDFLVGRSALVGPLAKRLATSSKRVYVAIGRATFSAAVTNAVDLKKIGAVLLGEPAGERPNGYQESRDMLLPDSAITVTYSTKFYQNVNDPENILRPDVEVDPSFELLKQHADPVLLWLQHHS